MRTTIDCLKPVKMLPQGAMPLTLVTRGYFYQWLAGESQRTRNICSAPGFKAAPGTIQPLYDRDGKVQSYLAIVDNAQVPGSFKFLPNKLPEGTYYAPSIDPAINADALTMGWGIGGYRFDKFTALKPAANLCLRYDASSTYKQLLAIYNTRDLINRPTNDLGIAELEGHARSLAQQFNAQAQVHMVQDDKEFPLIWHVGKAAVETPRLIDMRWSAAGLAPEDAKINLTLVGKGVVYDSGGLALKPGASMKGMKKDMGGAAHVLGLAQMIMSANLPVNLRVLVPAVENAINEKALRNGDIIKARNGLTIEIANTDAEGRLILADALTYAGEDDVKPDLIIDFATLTGAALSVPEPGTPVIFTGEQSLARALEDIGEELDDRFQPIRLDLRNSWKISTMQADVINTAPGLPGHIYAAHFLNAFSPAGVPRVHIDQSVWRGSEAEDQGLRTTFAYIRKRVLAP